MFGRRVRERAQADDSYFQISPTRVFVPLFRPCCRLVSKLDLDGIKLLVRVKVDACQRRPAVPEVKPQAQTSISQEEAPSASATAVAATAVSFDMPQPLLNVSDEDNGVSWMKGHNGACSVMVAVRKLSSFLIECNALRLEFSNPLFRHSEPTPQPDDVRFLQRILAPYARPRQR